MRKNPSNDLPIDYRKTDLENMFGAIDSGESCSLIGVGSVGKSVLLRHAQREDVQASHLGVENARQTIFVLLDSHNVNHLEGKAKEKYGCSWKGWELAVSQMILSLVDRRYEEFGIIDEEIEEIEKACEQIEKNYDRFTSPQTLLDSQRGFRNFAKSIFTLLHDTSVEGKPLIHRIVFMLDELEAFFRDLPPVFFEQLRAIRDADKGRVVYVTTSREAPKTLTKTMISQGHWIKEDGTTVEAFTELLHGHEFYVNLLDEDSFRYSWMRMCERDNVSLDEPWFKLFHEATAGHAGLMRRSFRSLVEYRDTQAINLELTSLIDYLTKRPNVLEECQILVDSLSAGQREALKKWLQLPKDTESVGTMLREDPMTRQIAFKHLLYLDQKTKRPKIIPLLANFLHKYPEGYTSLYDDDAN